MPLGAFSDGPKVACGCRHQQTHARSPHIVYIQCTDSGKENTVSGTCQPVMLIHVWLNFIIVAFNKQSSEGKTHPEGSALSRGHKKCPSAEVRNRKKQMSYSLKKVIFFPKAVILSNNDDLLQSRNWGKSGNRHDIVTCHGASWEHSDFQGKFREGIFFFFQNTSAYKWSY